MILVLAGDYRQFEHWCWEQHRSAHDRNLIYAATEHHTRGIHNANYVIVGTFFARQDADLIWEGAKYAERP